MAKYKNIIFDFDSTLVSIEGLDEIARRRGQIEKIKQITNSGMNGNLSFNKSLKTRFEIISPNLKDIELLIKDYQNSLIPGAADLIKKLQKNGLNVFVSTGGIKAAVLPVCKKLGIKDENVFAVCTTIDTHGNLVLKETCIMTKDFGKIQIVHMIRRSGLTVVIGDGMTDFEAGKHAEKFVGFGGIVQRERVKLLSEHYITELSLTKLLKYIC